MVDEDHDFEKNENPQNKAVISPTLSKFWKTKYEFPAIYTGGKLLFSNKKKQILCISNFTINVYDFEKRELIKKISHVILHF